MEVRINIKSITGRKKKKWNKKIDKLVKNEMWDGLMKKERKHMERCGIHIKTNNGWDNKSDGRSKRAEDSRNKHQLVCYIH